ncbi:MAG: tetratricopeptide repeat protein [Betaproteobacteria bacterium]|nr:tetratricopeptide repeat protein [Betaproteobacteria bacterium]
MAAKRVLALALTVGAATFLSGAGSPSISRPPAPSEPAEVRYYNDGVKAERVGDYARAVELYRRAIAEKRDFPDAHNNLGFSLRRIAEGYIQQAMKEYGEALRSAPDHAAALEYQGELYLRLGELRKARDNIDRLQKLNPAEAAKLRARLDQLVAEAKAL